MRIKWKSKCILKDQFKINDGEEGNEKRRKQVDGLTKQQAIVVHGTCLNGCLVEHVIIRGLTKFMTIIEESKKG